MRYLHTMVRVTDLEASLDFYCTSSAWPRRRYENEKGRFTLVFLAAPGDAPAATAEGAAGRAYLELGSRDYTGGRNFGHLAYEVDDIYATASALWTMASPSTGRRATDTWLSSAPRTASRSKSCSRARAGAGRTVAFDGQYRQLVDAAPETARSSVPAVRVPERGI